LARIAITGASGFIGHALVGHVEACGHRVIPLSRRDLDSDLQRAIGSADVLVHLAGRAHILDEGSNDPRQAYRSSNVQLTERVLGAAIGAGVRRFVLMSSAGVLGNATPSAGVDDDAPAAPHDEYARSKLEAEQLVRTVAAGTIEAVILRPPVVYGPGAPGNFARILQAVIRGFPLPVGALRAPRSMIGLRNLCDLTLRASLHQGAAGATMLASDRETVSVRDLAVALGRGLGKRPLIFSVPVPVLTAVLRMSGRSADVARLTSPFVVHARRASELLDWSPPFTLAEEIDWTVGRLRTGARS
jgi:nucleoside-diphosphate-sugar epimerase